MNYIGWQEVLFLVIGAIVIVIPLWMVFSKAGYPGVYSLGMMVPLLNIALLYFLGFSEWPVLRELKAQRTSR